MTVRAWRWLAGALMSALVLCLLACGAKDKVRVEEEEDDPADAGPPWLEDITNGSGLSFTYRNGEETDHYVILESLGGGVALIDYDGDGLLDIYFPGGGRFTGPDKKTIAGLPGKLYRNLGKGKFQDVTKKVGLDKLAGGKPWFYTHGAAVADYDRDGRPDLLVTGYGRVALFRNESDGKGGRRFRDVTAEAGLLREGHFWSTSAAFGDLDGDGWPELYLCQYVDWSWKKNPLCNGYTTDVTRDICPPKQYDAMPHALYHNVPGPDGKGRVFKDVSKDAGLRMNRPDKDYGKGLGVVMVDVDGDGKPDIYVANDTTDNFLYKNESKPGQVKLRECGFDLGVARDGNGTPNGSMGVDAADYDGSGQPSIWVTNYEAELHALYRNRLVEGRRFFFYSTQPAGLAVIGQNYVGFGTSFVDLDNDGHEDIVVTNGHVIRHPYRCGLKQKPIIFRNQGDGRFVEAPGRGGSFFRAEHRGRGLAVGDLDNDGRADLVFSPVNESAAILRNIAPVKRWVGLTLAGKDRADVVGARVQILSGKRTLTRFAKGGGSYLSSGDRRILAGLGDEAGPVKVRVSWPSGEPRVQIWKDLKPGQYWRLEQGKKEAGRR